MRICHRSLAKEPGARNDGEAVDLDLAHLRSFLAIVRYGGYHRAAEALHLTQPAVSRHMRRLEEQLGEPLFARRGRGVELTPYGEQAAIELGAVLAAHDQALARLQRGDGDAKAFVLGAIENLVDPVLPDLIAVVRDQIGDRAVQLRVDRSYELVERLGRGGVDAAIVVDPRGTPGAVEIGPVTLRWWAAPALASAPELPRPLPLVAYDPPCGLRDLGLGRGARDAAGGLHGPDASDRRRSSSARCLVRARQGRLATGPSTPPRRACGASPPATAPRASAPRAGGARARAGARGSSAPPRRAGRG